MNILSKIKLRQKSKCAQTLLLYSSKVITIRYSDVEPSNSACVCIWAYFKGQGHFGKNLF